MHSQLITIFFNIKNECMSRKNHIVAQLKKHGILIRKTIINGWFRDLWEDSLSL